MCAAGGVTDTELTSFEALLHVPAIHQAQAGLLADMDYVADVLFHRVANSVAA